MLYKLCLVKSDLFTAQNSDFYIWSGFFYALRDFSGKIYSVYGSKIKIFLSDLAI